MKSSMRVCFFIRMHTYMCLYVYIFTTYLTISDSYLRSTFNSLVTGVCCDNVNTGIFLNGPLNFKSNEETIISQDFIEILNLMLTNI